jgi:alanyl-tRNA synthetase
LLVTAESSIGSNLRRVEALTGTAAYEFLADVRTTLDDTSRLLRIPAREVPQRVRELLERTGALEAEAAKAAERRRAEQAGDLAAAVVHVGDAGFVVAELEGIRPDELRGLALQIRDRIGSGVVVLGSLNDGKGALVGAATKDLVERGISAAELIAGAARELGGGGSRDPELSQAGGPNGAALPKALDLAREAVAGALTEV